MLIWDRILKAVEASKFKIRMEKEPPCRTIVTVDGEELNITLKEKSARVPGISCLSKSFSVSTYQSRSCLIKAIRPHQYWLSPLR